MPRKTNKKSNTGLYVVLIILAIGLVATSIGFSVGGGADAPVVDEEGNLLPVCTGEVEPSVTINAYNADTFAAITEAGIYREIGTKTWKAWTPGTALTVLEANKEYEFYPGITSTDFIDHAYGAYFTYTVSCKNDQSSEIEMFDDEIETEVTATFYNKDDNAAAQAFLAGDIYTVEARLKAGKDQYFGNPTLDKPNVMVLKLNVSEWETPVRVNVKGGEELKRVSVPTRFQVEALDASGFTTYAYELPVIEDKELTIEMELEADSSNAPSIDGTAYFYAGGYFLDSDDGEVKVGVETEDGADVATDAADSLTLDFTA